MTLRVGVLGTGFAKSVQIPGFTNHQDYEVTAVWGRTHSKAQEVATQFGIDTVYENWEELMADSTIDLVSIVTPVHQHFEMTMEALEQGKHVLCEKPMAFDAEEALLMQREADQEQLVGMINHEFRQLPHWRYFHDLVQAGELGQIYDVDISMNSSGRVPSAVSERNWNWWADLYHGGGLWGALGSHLIDFYTWTFGPIERITGNLMTNTRHLRDASTGQTRVVTSDDSFQSLFTTAYGVKGKLHGSSTHHGGEGSLFLAHGSECALKVKQDGTLWKGVGSDWEQLTIPAEYGLRELNEGEPRLIPPFEKLLTHMKDGIDRGYSPSPSFEDGLSTQLVLDALREADAKQAWVTI
ncbi:MAG: Gfo/Idh/MocA family protein [Candidatus Kariarchaeaceae archaeon]|jgi:predicted dehydrogenase